MDGLGARYSYFSSKDFDSFASLMANFANVVSARNKSARENGEPMYAPELHISSHGCKDGIICKGSLIDWETLRGHLLELATRLDCIYSPERNWPWAEKGSCLWLSLSCCYAAYASECLFKPECFACAVLICPTTEIYTEDCARVFYEMLKFRMSQKVLDNGQGIVELRRISRDIKPAGPAGPVKFLVRVSPYTPNPNFQPPPGYHPNDPIQYAQTGAAPGIENKAGGSMKKSVKFKVSSNHFSGTASGITIVPSIDGMCYLVFDRIATIPERYEFEEHKEFQDGKEEVRHSNAQTVFSEPCREIIATIGFTPERFVACFGAIAEQLAKLPADSKPDAIQESSRD